MVCFNKFDYKLLYIMTMVSTEWILNNLSEYILDNDVNLRHGWFQIKIDGVIRATNEDYRNIVMNEIESIITKPYFKALHDFERKDIDESKYWGLVARYTDVFQILRNIRSDYNLPKSELLNPNQS